RVRLEGHANTQVRRGISHSACVESPFAFYSRNLLDKNTPVRLLLGVGQGFSHRTSQFRCTCTSLSVLACLLRTAAVSPRFTPHPVPGVMDCSKSE
ncbi:MAG: hypothetical protein ACPIOQ_02390, partial [Promethearchaeia archaeon]